ncbi:STM3941 family protein [Cytobacillus gottheilii]|uniref:STM3941 family protein n=1 Tax=Cytobacillus gottheilii TaxID=859144 RepID=UPI0009BA75B0|nr:STM3941 family protein [Cytobacillus gottheilii]
MENQYFYSKYTEVLIIGILTGIAGIITLLILTAAGDQMSTFSRTLTIILCVFFLATSLLLLLTRKSRQKKPAITLNDQGITIHINPGYGFIGFENIDGVMLYKRQWNKMIGIVLHKEEKFIESYAGMRKMNLINNRKQGYPAVELMRYTIADSQAFIDALKLKGCKVYQHSKGGNG